MLGDTSIALKILVCIFSPAYAALVQYDFHINYFAINPDGYGKSYVRGINNVFPGPEVRVRKGDRLQVHVYNNLPTEGISFHWHGFEMRSAWEYDGAVGINQCEIEPGTNFTYDFIVDEFPGTYQYHEHAHIGHVGARGLFGNLIVDPPLGEQEPWQYDEEASLLLFDHWPKSLHEMDLSKWAGLTRSNTVSHQYNDIGLSQFHNLLVNGKGGFALMNAESPRQGWVSQDTRVEDLFHITPNEGETWRLRIQNVGVLFNIRFRIDGHRLTVVQADGSDVEPYVCDAVTMASGERFDVLVTFDKTPGSYWMRSETLEDGWGFHHGQLSVLRYNGTEAGILPTMGYPMKHKIFEAPELVIMNCVEDGPISDTCRPITDLRLKIRQNHTHGPPVAPAGTSTHDFELNFRAFGKPDDSHFTRVIDFAHQTNDFGDDQFGGEYVQFLPPTVPYSHTNGTSKGEYTNTLKMEIHRGETVRVFLQIQDRTAHPWHMHGHKFAVLGTWSPDYTKDCDIIFCRAANNRWLGRDGPPGDLLDASVAPMKDTVHVPAGGWVVIQFTADNPGWWFFHCHMAIHHHDGMAVIMLEDLPNVPASYSDIARLNSLGFPTCTADLAKLERRLASDMPGGMSCSCWTDPEKFFGNEMRSTYKCAKSYLCGHLFLSPLEPTEQVSNGLRSRSDGRWWRWIYTCVLLVLVCLMFLLKQASTSVRKRNALLVAKLGEAADANRDSTQDTDKEPKLDEVIPFTPSHEIGANVKALELPTVSLTLLFDAACKLPNGNHAVKGRLGPGTVFALIGTSSETLPWLQFFGSQAQDSNSIPHITGQVSLGGLELNKWRKKLLRQACTFIPNCETELLQRGSTASDAVALPLRLLGTDTNKGGSMSELDEEPSFFTKIARVLLVFGLLPDSGRLVRELPPAKLKRLIAARSVVLPRNLIVMEDPLSGLDPQDSAKTLGLFYALAKQTGMIIIFSASSLSSDDVKYVTQRMECSYTGLKYVTDTPYQQQAKTRMLTSAKAWFQPEAESDTFLPTWEDIKRCSPMKAARQFGVLLQTELAQGFAYEYVTLYHFLESLGLGISAGLVWVSCNSRNTQVALGETVGLLFYTCAVWTVPPCFQALAATPSVVARVKHDTMNGLYPIPEYVAVLFLSNMMVSFVWVALFQTVAYTFADIGSDLPHLLIMHLVMVLNVLALRGVGMVLGILIPRAAAGAVVCNIIAQLQMLTNGFYTKLDPSLSWIVEFSIPRLSFRALQKLEYSWRDTFEVHPMMGIGGAGFPTKYIPAEVTGFFGLMRDRGMNVMQSPESDDYAVPEVLRLLLIAVLSFSFFGFALKRHCRASEASSESCSGCGFWRDCCRRILGKRIKVESEVPACDFEATVVVQDKGPAGPVYKSEASDDAASHMTKTWSGAFQHTRSFQRVSMKSLNSSRSREIRTSVGGFA